MQMLNYETYRTLFKASHYDPETDYFTPEEFQRLDEQIQELIISQKRKYLEFLAEEYS